MIRFLKIKQVQFVIVFFSMTLFLASCKEKLTSAIKEQLEAGDESVTSSNFKRIEVDSLYSLSVPKYMKVIENLNDQASLQYGNVYKNLYTVVIHEDIQDFIDYYKEIGEYVDSLSVIDNYTKGQVSYFNQAIANCDASFYGNKKISNYEARHYKYTGTIADQKVVYLMAYIETEADLFMIMNWTSLDRFSRFENTFNAINSSFEYILNTTEQYEIQ